MTNFQFWCPQSYLRNS